MLLRLCPKLAQTRKTALSPCMKASCVLWTILIPIPVLLLAAAVHTPGSFDHKLLVSPQWPCFPQTRFPYYTWNARSAAPGNNLTGVYLDILHEIATSGTTFKDKNALLTGVGNGSIGVTVVKGLSPGGAHVVITTSSHSRKTVENYQSIFQSCTPSPRYPLRLSHNDGLLIPLFGWCSYWVCLVLDSQHFANDFQVGLAELALWTYRHCRSWTRKPRCSHVLCQRDGNPSRTNLGWWRQSVVCKFQEKRMRFRSEGV